MFCQSNYRVAIITADKPRHLYFLKEILKLNKIELILIKKKSFYKKNKNFYKLQDKEENSYFGDININQNNKIFFPKKINSKFVINKLKEKKINMLIVFGAPILNKNIFNSLQYGAFNLHTGILPDYRGVDSLYWAIYNKDYNKIGFTIHSIDEKIDRGSIVYQKKININNFKKFNIFESFFYICEQGINKFAKLLNQKKLIIKKKNKKNIGKIYFTNQMNSKIISNIIKNKKFKKIIK